MILPTAYLPTITQLALMQSNPNYELEHFEHFVKQSYRNRCEIYGANGKLSLIIPLKKWKNHSLVKDIQISYEDNWQKLHWRSIESAYRASPYFEFYEEDLLPFYSGKTFKYLVDFNEVTLEVINQLLKLDLTRTVTESYSPISKSKDWRQLIHPKMEAFSSMYELPHYIQVFEDKEGFIPNLSVIDLLFNLGPQSKTYLEQLNPNK